MTTEEPRDTRHPTARLEKLSSILIAAVVVNSAAVAYGFHELGQLSQSIRWLLAPPIATAATALPISRGPSTATKVVVDVYSDFGCTYCRESAPAIDSVRREFGDKVYWRYRYLASPLRADPLSFEAALVGVCTAKDGGPWELYSAIRPSLPWTRESLEKEVVKLAAIHPDLQSCTQSEEATDRIWSDVFEAAARGVRSTPTLYINGKKISAQITAAPLRTFVQNELDLASHRDSSQHVGSGSH